MVKLQQCIEGVMSGSGVVIFIKVNDKRIKFINTKKERKLENFCVSLF